MYTRLPVTALLTIVASQSAFALRARSKRAQPNFVATTYYAPAAGLTGEALKTALNGIVRGHTRYNYTPCVWHILMEADQDLHNPSNVVATYTRRSIP